MYVGYLFKVEITECGSLFWGVPLSPILALGSLEEASSSCAAVFITYESNIIFVYWK